MEKQKISIFWFRRDLRLDDNRGLYEALKSPYPVLPLFIFDTSITDELNEDDPRISFIYDQLVALSNRLKTKSGSLLCMKGKPETVWNSILLQFDVQRAYANEDYEPYAIERDMRIAKLLSDSGIEYKLFKDQVIFAKDEVLKADQMPYTVYTPYKNKWLNTFNAEELESYHSESGTNYLHCALSLPRLSDLGFVQSRLKVPDYTLENIRDYEKYRNIPAINGTSLLSPHLRFGTVSIRNIMNQVFPHQIFMNELIWREFFMQILYHFPKVVHSNFKHKYDHIPWRNNPVEFEKWKNGETGYPMVDAGMRQLNATAYMHNRVRMVVAGFLCKHLLIDWRWGEAYFAKKLLDYELASNNGNWQWAAGTGCDAAPYFRVFNPSEQLRKFDPEMKYIRRWIPEFDTSAYPQPLVEHKMARERAIASYKKGLLR